MQLTLSITPSEAVSEDTLRAFNRKAVRLGFTGGTAFLASIINRESSPPTPKPKTKKAPRP